MPQRLPAVKPVSDEPVPVLRHRARHTNRHRARHSSRLPSDPHTPTSTIGAPRTPTAVRRVSKKLRRRPSAGFPGVLMNADRPVDNAPYQSFTHAGMTIEGWSRAAVQSYWRVPELKIGF